MMNPFFSPVRSIALISMLGLIAGCGGDPVTVVNVPADQIKDAKPAPPPPSGLNKGRPIGPRGGTSALLPPNSEAGTAKPN